jgi:hypothetical protein
MARAMIVDMDGTLALKGDRKPFDYARCIEDACNQPIALLVRAYRKTYRRVVIVLSGREAWCAPETRQWLAMHEIPCDILLMRPTGDYRKDWVVKRELYEAHVQPKYTVDLVLDDRDAVVAMWRNELLLPCFQVAYGDF